MLLIPISIYDRQPLLTLSLVSANIADCTESLASSDEWLEQLANGAATVAAVSQDSKVEYE